jgi:hypothetical protein
MQNENKITNATANEIFTMTAGTHYKGIKIAASLNRLIKLLGNPLIIEKDQLDNKIHQLWVFNPNKDGSKIITVYDWTETQHIPPDLPIYWHVGGRNVSRRDIINYTLKSAGFNDDEIIEDEFYKMYY